MFSVWVLGMSLMTGLTRSAATFQSPGWACSRQLGSGRKAGVVAGTLRQEFSAGAVGGQLVLAPVLNAGSVIWFLCLL